MTKLSPALDAAITYAGHGLRVFPLKARSKEPATAHGFKDATVDGGVLHRRFMAAGADANIGIATGGDLIVVDLDGPEGTAWLDDNHRAGREIPETWAASTGRGTHIYLRVDRPTPTRPGISPKVDIKGEGGYVVAPPSVHPDGSRYAWVHGGPGSNTPIRDAPDWLKGLLEAVERPRTPGSPAGGDGYPSVINDGEGRESTLVALAGSLRRRGLGEGEVLATLRAFNAGRIRPPKPEADLERIARSVARYAPDRVAVADERLEARVRAKGPVPTDAERRTARAEAPDDDEDESGGDPPASGRAGTAESAGSSSSRPDPIGITAAELVDTDLPEPRWAVEDILPAGLAILAGKPKVGKSFMVLDILLNVAGLEGQALDAYDVEHGDALYLALEDTQRRLQSRLRKLLAGRKAPERLHLFTDWPKFGPKSRGDQLLVEWLEAHPDTRLVVIDTFAKARQRRGRDGNVYDEDYQAVAGIKAHADRAGVAVLVLHHLRKMAAEDPLEEISGSMGVSGAADTIWVLKRTRSSRSGTMFVTGRDVTENEIAVTWPEDTLHWTSLGNAEAVRLSVERQTVVDVLRRAEGPLSNDDIAKDTKLHPGSVRRLIRDMLHDGQVGQPSRGLYTLSPTFAADGESSPKSQSSPNVRANRRTSRTSEQRQLLTPPNKVFEYGEHANNPEAMFAMFAQRGEHSQNGEQCRHDSGSVHRRGRALCAACGALIPAA